MVTGTCITGHSATVAAVVLWREGESYNGSVTRKRYTLTCLDSSTTHLGDEEGECPATCTVCDTA